MEIFEKAEGQRYHNDDEALNGIVETLNRLELVDGIDERISY